MSVLTGTPSSASLTPYSASSSRWPSRRRPAVAAHRGDDERLGPQFAEHVEGGADHRRRGWRCRGCRRRRRRGSPGLIRLGRLDASQRPADFAGHVGDGRLRGGLPQERDGRDFHDGLPFTGHGGGRALPILADREVDRSGDCLARPVCAESVLTGDSHRLIASPRRDRFAATRVFEGSARSAPLEDSRRGETGRGAWHRGGGGWCGDWRWRWSAD